VNPWILLVGALYVVLEWFVASLLAASIGWGGVAIVVLVLVIVGVAVMRRAGSAAFRSLRPVQVDGVSVSPAVGEEMAAQVGRDVGDAGALFVSGLFIAVPGIVTSLVGLVLLVPPVRTWARRAVAARVRRRAEAAGLVRARTTTVRGTVVGDVVREDPDHPNATARGEILQGEIVREDGPSTRTPPQAP
jgi:UPF0716 protein FxsA